MRFFGEKNTGSLSFVVWQSTGKSHLWKNGLVKEALCRVQVIEEFLAINCCRRTVDAFCFCAVVTKHVCWLEGSIDTKPKKHTHKSQATFTDTLSASKKQQQNAIFCATIHISYHLGVGSLPGNSGHQDAYICLGGSKNPLEFTFNSKLQRYDPTTAQRVHPLSQELSRVVDLIKGELGQHVDAAFCRRREMMTISWRVTEVMMNRTEMVGYFLMSLGYYSFGKPLCLLFLFEVARGVAYMSNLGGD